jgi:AraC-like DNA-binding protein
MPMADLPRGLTVSPMDVRFWISSRLDCTPQMWTNDAPHEAWSKLYVVTRGQARYAVARPGEPPQWIDLLPGRIYLVPGGRRQLNACRAAFHLAWCHFTVQDDALAARIAALDTVHDLGPCDADSAAVVAAAATPGEVNRLRATALVFSLLARLPDPLADPHADLRRRLAPAVSTLEYRFAERLDIPQLARRCGLGLSRFNQLFRRLLGTSAHDYQISLRLAEAKRLLRTSDLPVQDIAVRCGYPNAFAFTRLFTAKAGLSPSRYRAGSKGRVPPAG